MIYSRTMLQTTERRQRVDDDRKSRTKAALLDASEGVFARRGYHSALVSEIVAEAGVGQGTFYRHFESKRAVLDALFDRLVDQVLDEFRGSLVEMPTNLEEYRAVSYRGGASAVAVVTEHQDAVRLILRQGPAVDEAFAARVEGMHDQIADLAALYLRHAIEQGFARPCDPELVGQAIVGQVMRIILLWLDGRLESRSREDVLREMIEFMVHGYGKDQSI